MPATAALLLLVVWGALTFGIRVVIHYRQTGTTGLHALRPGASAVERTAEVMVIAGLVAGVAAPILELRRASPPLWSDPAVRWIGFVVALVGVVATFGAQIAMGRSWRVGVDPGERTELVTKGPFELVRNPIFSAMMLTMAGIALQVANVVAIASLVLLIIAIEIQVRAVEEPYLARVHGSVYTDYIKRVGRFVPGVGRVERSAR